MPPISHVCNDVPSSIICEDGKIPIAGNASRITNIPEIYEMEIHDLFMSIWVRVECTADRDWPPCNVSKGRSTWCLAQYLPSAWQTFVEFIFPQQIDWFWWYTLHLKARSLQGAIFYPLRHRADVKAKVVTIPIPVSPMLQYASATIESVHATNPNPLKLSFSVEVWENISTYTLNPSWIIITPLSNLPSQFVAYCASTFNCRLWRNLRGLNT